LVGTDSYDNRYYRECGEKPLGHFHPTPADRRHQSDLRQAPMLPGDQEHIEIRPEGAAHVSEQEVDGVQRQRVETPALG
jgi:hypothetical protein